MLSFEGTDGEVGGGCSTGLDGKVGQMGGRVVIVGLGWGWAVGGGTGCGGREL